jgi:flagellar basal body-associated protein FliL
MSQYQPPSSYPPQGHGQPQPPQPLPPQPPMYQPQQQWQQSPQPPIYQSQQPPRPRKSRKRLWLIIGVVVALLVVVIAVVSGGGKNAPTSNTGTNTSSNSNQVTQPASQPTAVANAIGKPVQVGDWLVTVNSVKTSKGTEFSTPKSGDTYLVVDVTVKNTSSTNQTVSSLVQFNLKDSTGQQYTEALTDFAKPPDGAVTPGSLLRGQFAYEVPLSEHTFTFSYQSDLTGSDITEWHVSI